VRQQVRQHRQVLQGCGPHHVLVPEALQRPAPGLAVRGTGALVKRPVVVTDALGGDTIAIRDMMYLSLTYDHRLIDGAKAARFLSLIKARLEAGDFAGELGI